jgi:hypothetical protein
VVRIKRVLSFSNVIACLALFIALGGSVYAAGKISGKQIKPNSLPGNRVKAKTLTAKQIKPGSLTGAQIKAGSLSGAQINVETLSGVTASRLSSIQYANASASLGAGAGNATATCPAGTNVVGGGASVSDDENAFVNDSGPNSARNGWDATGFGEPGTTLTVTAICTAAASVSG